MIVKEKAVLALAQIIVPSSIEQELQTSIMEALYSFSCLKDAQVHELSAILRAIEQMLKGRQDTVTNLNDDVNKQIILRTTNNSSSKCLDILQVLKNHH